MARGTVATSNVLPILPAALVPVATVVVVGFVPGVIVACALLTPNYNSQK